MTATYTFDVFRLVGFVFGLTGVKDDETGETVWADAADCSAASEGNQSDA